VDFRNSRLDAARCFLLDAGAVLTVSSPFVPLFEFVIVMIVSPCMVKVDPVSMSADALTNEKSLRA
jgi:hypothetical protein